MFKPSLVKSGRQKGGQVLSERVDEEMSHVLCSRTELKHMQNRASGDRWPARARAPVWRSGASSAVHPTGDAGARGCGRSAHARCGRAPQRVSERLMMVACREPKTRSAADGSSPSASAESM